MISGRNLPIGIGIAVQKGRSFPISYLPLLKIGFLDNSKPRVTGGRKATGLTESVTTRIAGGLMKAPPEGAFPD